jgi:enhanced filamentous growth protein 1
MNSLQSYADVHQSHMSAPNTHVPSTGAPSALSHYPQYQQPPLLQPGPGSYPSQSAYGAYGYGNGVGQAASAHPVSSSMSSALVPQTLPLPGTYEKFCSSF